MTDYEAILPYAKTDAQRTAIKACIKTGSNNKAATMMGIGRRVVDKHVKRVKEYAARQGFAPEFDMKKPAPQGFHVKGVSSLYDDEGNLKIQWVKTQADKDDVLRRIIDAFTEAFSDVRGDSETVQVPAHADCDLLTVYPMGDPHIGMYAWAEEAGEDFDCEIAERNLTNAVKNLVERSPSSHTAIVLNLGDFFHSDSLENRSLNSGHSFDVDTRWTKVLWIGAKAMIQCVYSALAKHQQVIVKNVIGNHDTHTSQALSLALSLYFENNDRVIVDSSPSRFWFYQFGSVLIGSTHGDTVKPEQLGGIMATNRPKEWGNTEHRYWYTGHIHTKNAMELHGCLWESFRTLAAKDAWHASKGYSSGRDMVSIHHHKDFGEVERHTISLSMLRAA